MPLLIKKPSWIIGMWVGIDSFIVADGPGKVHINTSELREATIPTIYFPLLLHHLV